MSDDTVVEHFDARRLFDGVLTVSTPREGQRLRMPTTLKTENAGSDR